MSRPKTKRERMISALSRGELPPLDELAVESPAMLEALRRALLTALLGGVVLLVGPTGSGKGAVAAWLATTLGYKDKFSTAVIGEGAQTLIASKLFGHIKGAFTGASRNRAGVFDAEGAVFIDEIGNASEETQAALLRVVQDGEFSAVGSEQVSEVAADLVIYATHSPDELRQDLRARLADAIVVLPALDDRPEDIAPIIAYALEHEKSLHGAQVAPKTITHAQRLTWPGNVRVLLAALKRAHREAILDGSALILPRHLDTGRREAVDLVGVRVEQGATALPQRTIPPTATRVAVPPPAPRKSAADLTDERVPVKDRRWVEGWRLTQERGWWPRRALGERLGLARAQSGRIVRAMIDAGRVKREGRVYRWIGPPPEGV